MSDQDDKELATMKLQARVEEVAEKMFVRAIDPRVSHESDARTVAKNCISAAQIFVQEFGFYLNQ